MLHVFYMSRFRTRERAHFVVFDHIRPWLGCDRYECSVCGVIGLKPARRELAVVVKWDEAVDDVEQVLTSKIVSRRFRQAVAANGLSGIEFYAAREFRPARAQPKLIRFADWCAQEYEVGWVSGVARMDPSTGVHTERHCDACGWFNWTLPLAGVVIDPETWDGSDFFQVRELPGPWFMSQRAVDVLSAAGLSNFSYIRAEDHHPRRVPGFPRK